MSELAEQYRRRFDARLEYRQRVWQVLTSKFFARYVSPQARLLDLGCGYGHFVNNIVAGEKYALDLNPDARGRLAAGVRFLEQDSASRWPFEDGTLDVVFTSNFLEHLPDKAAVAATVAEARRCLRVGGSFIALGPNLRILHGAYWDFWDHNVALTDRSIVELLELRGFSIDRCIPRFLPYTMAEGRPAPIALVEAYLQLPLFWPLFGRQFLVIARPAVASAP